MPHQLTTVAVQAAGLHARRLCSIKLFYDIGQKQDLPGRATDRFGNVPIGLRLTLGPGGGVKVAAKQRRQVPCLGTTKNQLLRLNRT